MDQVARFQETPRELAIFDEELAEAGWWPSVAEASALAYMEGSWLHRDLALLFFSDDGPPQTFWRDIGPFLPPRNAYILRPADLPGRGRGGPHRAGPAPRRGPGGRGRRRGLGHDSSRRSRTMTAAAANSRWPPQG